MTHPVRRVHYFYGQLLTSEDLQAEQDYHREMRYLHNRLLGHGVVTGLDVTVADDGTVVVGAGLAIDRFGREIVLPVATTAAATCIGSDGWWDVVITWQEQPDGFVAPRDDCGESEESEESPDFTRWLETPDLALAPTGEAPAAALVLGRVLITDGAATSVDASGRGCWERADPSAAPGVAE
jgi:hypothetical protein